jgi:IclR family acetate operon transcriptional repressor
MVRVTERRSVQRNETPTATVGRVTALLNVFAESPGDLGITEIAETLGLAKSVVHRLAAALTKAGYLTQTPGTRRYALGPSATRLGHAALGQKDIRGRARPLLRDLAAVTGETTTLSTLAGDGRVYAEQVESTHPVRQSVRIGEVAPLHAGASGKAMLAFLPETRRASVLAHLMKSRVLLADGSKLDIATLKRDLDSIRRRGFATSQAERILGATSAAAPVFDNHGDVVGSISVASVTVRHNKTDLARFGELARLCADRLSAELGWPGRAPDRRAS